MSGALSGVGLMRPCIGSDRSATGPSVGSLTAAVGNKQGAEQGAAHMVPVPEQPSNAMAAGTAMRDIKTTAINARRIPGSVSHHALETATVRRDAAAESLTRLSVSLY